MSIKEKTYGLNVTNKCGQHYRYEQRFVFPTSTLPDMAKMIGTAALLNLIHYFGGAHIYVPAASTVKKMILRAAIHEEIQRLKKEGKKNREQIADELAITFKGKMTKATLRERVSQYCGRNNKDRALKQFQHSDLLQLVVQNKELFDHHRLL